VERLGEDRPQLAVGPDLGGSAGVVKVQVGEDKVGDIFYSYAP
jgi:hypothetical protein